MRRDRALLAAAEAGATPVLRLFGFQPSGITLGLNQAPDRELDLEGCAVDGVPWAVRPTGGRAIFHAEEWTYSFAAPIEDPLWGGSQASTYARVGEMLVSSLVRLGVPATFAAAPRDAATRPRATDGPSAPCFASTARHEVTVEGRKLVGSAQRRSAAAWLQQGSVLIGDGHLRLADYLPLPPARRDAVRALLRAGTAPAGSWLGCEPPLERWADALASVLPGVRRVDAAAGLFLLTPPNSRSYTSTTSQVVS
jgi:lipoate-protein ligase A